jgi:hypothetical protein
MHHKRKKYTERRNTYARREHERRYGRWIWSDTPAPYPYCDRGWYEAGVGAEGNTPKASHGTPGRPWKRMWAKKARRRQDRDLDTARRFNAFDSFTTPKYVVIGSTWDFY